MPRAIIWTAQRDETIRSMRDAGSTWDAIATAVDVSRWAVIARAATIGMDTKRVPVAEPPEALHDKRRGPLPANHPLALQVLAEAPPLDLD